MFSNYVGVDLGTTYLAFATLRVNNLKEESRLEYSFVKFPPDLPSPELHRRITEAVFFAIRGGQPPLIPWYTQGFVEGVFMGLNARTFARMTRVSHSVQIALFEHSVKNREIDPKAWRKALFGKAMTKKEEGLQWAKENLPGLEDVPKSKKEHLSEAAMIALAGRSLVEPEHNSGTGSIRSGEVKSLSL